MVGDRAEIALYEETISFRRGKICWLPRAQKADNEGVLEGHIMEKERLLQ